MDYNDDQNLDQQQEQDLELFEYERYLNMINVYMKYYNKLYSTNINLFNNINDYKPFSTNKQMEILYEHIHEIKQEQNPDNIIVRSPGYYDINNFNHLFLLEYDNVQVQSPYLVSLLHYIVDENIDDKKWNIICLK
jgi:hypothetical protein